jgi:hypothetical protein
MLRSSAYKWYDDRSFVDQLDFIKQIRHEYGDKLAQDKLVLRLVNLAPVTSLHSYLQDFRALYKDLDKENQTLTWVRMAFVSNVPGAWLHDLSSRIYSVPTVEALFDLVSGTAHVSDTGSPASGVGATSGAPMDLDALGKIDKKEFVNQIVCFKCGGYGHRADGCSSKKVSSKSTGAEGLRDK